MSLQFYQKQLEKIIRENQLYIRKYQDLYTILSRNSQKLISFFNKLFPSIDKFVSQNLLKDIDPLLSYYFQKINQWRSNHLKSTIQLILDQSEKQGLQDNLGQNIHKQQLQIKELLLKQNDHQFYEKLKQIKKQKESKKDTQIKQLLEEIDRFEEGQQKYLTKIQNLKSMILELQYQLTTNEFTNQKILKYYQNLKERQEEQIKQLQRKLIKKQQKINSNLNGKKQYTSSSILMKNEGQEQGHEIQSFEKGRQEGYLRDEQEESEFQQRKSYKQTNNINQSLFVKKYETNTGSCNFYKEHQNRDNRVNISLNGKTYNCYSHNQNWQDPSYQTDTTELRQSDMFYKKQKNGQKVTNTNTHLINESKQKKIRSPYKKKTQQY